MQFRWIKGVYVKNELVVWWNFIVKENQLQGKKLFVFVGYFDQVAG